ncbi:MAG: hypothetical protein Kow0020_05530 [Wenzhouxiangellaceae bacterium]
MTALAASGWLFYQERFHAPRPARDSGLTARVQALESAVSRIEGALSEVPDRDQVGRLEDAVQRIESESRRHRGELKGLETRLAQVDSRVNDRLAELAGTAAAVTGLENRLSGIERTLAALQSQSRVAPELARLPDLLRMQLLLGAARDRLRMAGDVAGARVAWAQALDQVRTWPDERYRELASRLEAELDALRAMKTAESADTISALLAAADAIQSLPLAGERNPSSASPAEVEEGGWRGRIRNVLDRLVRVERAVPGQLNPAEIDSLRARITAMLEATAVALARGDGASASVLAEATAGHIRRAFDTDAVEVQGVLQQLESVARAQSLPALALDGALAEIRRLIEAGQ